ncbi:MAG TPA: TMEM175 family protein [Allosphingosinicella sp.]|nr:TMEM175 family protein [Allosphingosinicella sp.]
MAGGKTDHPLERLVFFSDAVFAIAITLLVIEIHPPHLEQDGARPTLEALARLIPSFIGFVISFAVIGAFWSGHHRAFSLAARLGPGILVWNLLLLGTIAFMPFVTGFMSGNYGKVGPAVFYWSWLVLTALLNLRVNRIATGPAMRADGVSETEAATVPRRSLAVLFGAITALALSFFVPLYAPVGMATIPLWLLLFRLRGSAA